MLEEWLKDPRTITVTAILIALIAALVRETLMPGVTHRYLMAEKDKQLADKDKRIEKLEADIDRLETQKDRLLGYAEKATDLAAERRS